MKEGRTLTELAQELERQRHAKVDVIADTRQMEMRTFEAEALEQTDNAEDFERLMSQNVSRRPEQDIQLHLEDGTTYPILSNCHNQIRDRVRIPAKYYERMRAEAQELLCQNVNHWFAESPERRMLRALDGNARAFLSDRYARIDHFDICNAALPVLIDYPGLEVRSCQVTDSHLFVKAASKVKIGEVKRGDPVSAGVMLQNSETGQGRYKVSMFVERLVCTNGMKAMDLIGRTHLGARHETSSDIEVLLSDETKKVDDAALMLKTRDVVKGVLEGGLFETYLEKLRETTEHKITGDPVKAMEVLAGATDIREAEQPGILRHLIEGGDLSQYGVAQALTRYSQDVEDYGRATDFEAMGGQVIDMTPQQWQPIAEAA